MREKNVHVRLAIALRVLCTCFLLLNGCQLGPKYEPPAVAVPEEWKYSKAEPEKETVVPCVDHWWELFNDTTLNQLEELAIANSPNVYAAFDRVLEARASMGVSRADLYPQLSLNPSYLNTGQLFKIYLPPMPSQNAAVVNPFSNFPTVYRIHSMQYGLLANLSYELDLWGKFRGKYQSDVLNEEAEEEAYYTTLITLTTDLAAYYFQLRALDAQIEVLKITIEARRRSFNLTQKRYEKGLISYSDVAKSSLELTNTESDYYEAVRQRSLQENQIALSIGVPASAFCMESHPLREPPPEVPAGLPSDMMKRRPDIAQAERKMASEHALIGVAYASFYPSVELTGALGFLSPDFDNFLRWKSRFWQIGSNILQTLFDGGRNESNLELAVVRFYEASEAYKQQVLVAFREVEDALNSIEMQTKQVDRLRSSVDSASVSARLSALRYSRGVTNYLEVVDTERFQLDAERSYVTALGTQYLSTVQLIKALGGGWGSFDEEEEGCVEEDIFE